MIKKLKEPIFSTAGKISVVLLVLSTIMIALACADVFFVAITVTPF